MKQPTPDIETVLGIGKKLAQDLRARGYKNRSDLMRIIDELPAAAQMDLRYKPTRRIPRDKIMEVDTVLKKIFSRHDCKYLIAGSYRRKVPTSKDIDVVIMRNSCLQGNPLRNLTSMINSSRVRKPVKIKLIEPYSQGDDRISALLQINNSNLYYKVDFFIIPPAEWIPAIVYATGSQQFNIRMRSLAKKRGWKLNQRGLFDSGGQPFPVKTEKDLFRLLGMTYKTPEQRNLKNE